MRFLVGFIFLLFPILSAAFTINKSLVCVEENNEKYIDKYRLLTSLLVEYKINSLCLLEEGVSPEAIVGKELHNRLVFILNGSATPAYCKGLKERLLRLEDFFIDFYDSNIVGDDDFKIIGSNRNDLGDLSKFGLYDEALDVKVKCLKDKPVSLLTDNSNGKVIFRESLKELSKSQVEKVKGGKISYSESNLDSEKEANSSKFLLGYKYELDSSNRYLGSVIPYVSMSAGKSITRSIPDDTTSEGVESKEESKAVEKFQNLSAGFSLIGRSFEKDGWRHEFSGNTAYTKEKYTKAKAVSASIVYKPLRVGVVNDWTSFGSILIYPDLSLEVRRARIIDTGVLKGKKLEQFLTETSYSALGASLELSIATSNEYFPDTQVSFGYAHYKLFSHQFDHVSQRKFGLVHFLDRDQHFGIEVEYLKGEEGIFLEKVDKWNVSFVARY